MPNIISALFSPDDKTAVVRKSDDKQFVLNARGQLVASDGELLAYSYNDILWGEVEGFSIGPHRLKSLGIPIGGFAEAVEYAIGKRIL